MWLRPVRPFDDTLWIKGVGMAPLPHLISRLVWNHEHWMDGTQTGTSLEWRVRISFTRDLGLRSSPRKGR